MALYVKVSAFPLNGNADFRVMPTKGKTTRSRGVLRGKNQDNFLSEAGLEKYNAPALPNKVGITLRKASP